MKHSNIIFIPGSLEIQANTRANCIFCYFLTFLCIRLNITRTAKYSKFNTVLINCVIHLILLQHWKCIWNAHWLVIFNVVNQPLGWNFYCCNLQNLHSNYASISQCLYSWTRKFDKFEGLFNFQLLNAQFFFLSMAQQQLC